MRYSEARPTGLTNRRVRTSMAMNRDNPYRSPKTVADGHGDAVVDPMRLPWAWSGCLLFVGVCFLLLLNGQHFTNGTVFVGAVVASGLLWIWPSVRSRSDDQRRVACYVLAAHVFFAIIFMSGLPQRHRRQQRMNDLRNELRQSLRAADLPGP